jgi:hypothetical protein
MLTRSNDDRIPPQPKANLMRPLSCRIALLVVFAVCRSLNAQDDAKAVKKVDKLVLPLKIYALDELVTPMQQFPYNASLPTSGAASVFVSQPQTGGGGQGGGLFSVPTTVQFGGGGGGFGGGQAGGLSGAVDFGIQQHFVQDSYDVHESLINLITEHVDPESWDANGGKGTVSAVDNTLLIRQTESNHDAIRAFLKEFAAKTMGGQPLSVELWWLPLNSAAGGNPHKVLVGDRASTELNELSESTGGYHGTLKVRNRVTGNLCAGHRMPLVVGQIPVVGANSSGLQPIVNQVNIGINVEITAQLQQDWQGDGVRLALRTAMTTMMDHEPTRKGDDGIDRFELGSQVLETHAVCAFDVPVVVGSLSAVGLFAEDDEARKVVVVVPPTR